MPPRAQLEGLLAPGEITLETRVEVLGSLAYRISSEGEKFVLLLTAGDRVKLPSRLQPVLEDLMRRSGSFPVAELHPRLTDKSKVILARKLIENGVLTVLGKSG